MSSNDMSSIEIASCEQFSTSVVVRPSGVQQKHDILLVQVWSNGCQSVDAVCRGVDKDLLPEFLPNAITAFQNNFEIFSPTPG